MKKTAARILIALPLLALVLLTLWREDLRLWQAVSFAVVVLAAKEWGKLAGFEGQSNLFYTGWFALFAVIGEIFFSYNHTARELFLFAISVFWAVVVPWCLLGNRCFGRIIQGALGMLLLFAAWHAAGILFAADTNLLLAVFILVWVADTAAYFGGRRLGQNALAPTISPGKTREGFLVALAAVFLCAGAATWLFPDIPPAWLLAAAFSLFCLSVLGDLFESMNKRQAESKKAVLYWVPTEAFGIVWMRWCRYYLLPLYSHLGQYESASLVYIRGYRQRRTSRFGSHPKTAG